MEDLRINNMNISEEIAGYYSEFLANGCVINGQPYALNQIEQKEWKDFATWVNSFRPKKIYKYFPNKENPDSNYSIQALENNTVHLSSPSEFDDVYDSDIHIDYSVFERNRLTEYCRRCGIAVSNEISTNEIVKMFMQAISISLSLHHNYENIFTKSPESEMERLDSIRFCKSLIGVKNTDDLRKAVSLVLQEEYSAYIKQLKETFRIACFTTNPLSQLMWVMYADCHRGFCLEYTVFPELEKYKEIFFNLYPLIYAKKRSDMSVFFSNLKSKEFTEEAVGNIYYHGALRKSWEWAFQNEWRLLMPPGSKNINSDYNVTFFPITKVFLGNRMEAKKRKQIIDICNEKGIPYSGVRKNPMTFEMQECEIKCENCPTYRNKLQTI